MGKPVVEENIKLHFRRTFAAPRERVFRAWTDPEAVKQWFGPPRFKAVEVEIDLRVGGRYRYGLQELPEGEVFYKTGVYREVRRPSRLVYTWIWEHPELDVGETLVTVEFAERAEGTEVAVTHEFFPTVAARDRHRQGWGNCLDVFDQFVRGESDLHRQGDN